MRLPIPIPGAMRALCVATLLSQGVLPFATSDAQTISVNAGATGTTTLIPNGTLTVPVIIDLSGAGTTTIKTIASGMTWNAARLTFDSVRVLAGNGWTFTPNTSNAGSGSISFSATRPSALPATGTLANAFFTAAAVAGGTRVVLAPTAATNSAGSTIIASMRSRALDVCAVVPGVWGDVNADGGVNILDAQQIALYSVTSPVLNQAAVELRGDVTNDGVINIIDAQQIALFSVGAPSAARINTPSPLAPPATSVGLTAGSTNLFQGTSTQVVATPLAGAADLTGCAPTTWGSSNTGVAVVNTSGFVTAVGSGSANITATSGTVSSLVGIAVSQAPVATVNVSLAQTPISTGGGTTASAILLDANGNVLTGRTVVWSSSNPSRATVNPSTGAVTGISNGTANIIATSEGVSGQTTVTVNFVPVASVTVALAQSPLGVGLTTQATATLRDASGNILTGRTVTWTSLTTSRATVNSSTGVVLAVSPGTVNIRATSEGINGQATLTVAQVPVASMTVSLALPSIRAMTPIAATTTASAVTRDAGGNIVTGRVITWSSSNTAKAAVNATTGVVTGIAAGVADIIATCEGVTALATITVTTPPVATVTVALPGSLPVAGTATAVATTRDSLTNILTGRVVTWSTGSALIATVVPATGAVVAISTGTTNITATSEGRTGAFSLTVSGPSNEPFFTPGGGATLVMQDNMERYTTSTSMGAYPYQYSGPMLTPLPSPSQQSQPVDTARHKVIPNGRSGKAVRMIFSGGNQTSAAFATINLPSQPNNQTVFIQYWARIIPATSWPNSQPLAVKWLEAWHNNANGRLQWNTRYPSSANTKTTAKTVWQVIDQGESTTNGDQPFGPYFHQIAADTTWHRFTHAVRAHASTSNKNGFAKMWVDGTLVIHVEQSTVGVTPPGGLVVWCTQADVNNMVANDGTKFLVFGATQTTSTGQWIYDLDDLVWWRQ